MSSLQNEMNASKKREEELKEKAETLKIEKS
jgi:hypothetical protein